MISICIPVYNFDVRPLVWELHKQANALELGVEILVIDDASNKEFQQLNKEIAHLFTVVYLELPANIGRSRIRNLLSGKARNEWLLFMDCDSEITSDRFIAEYAANTNSVQVVCGGREYHRTRPQKEFVLHWKYGKSREVKCAKERGLNPYHSFMTNNFMVHKQILNRIQFDEDIMGYGHEDTLFGFELMRQNLPVLHINNPLLHIHLETHAVFLKKSQEAIANLHGIYLRSNAPDQFAKFVRLLRWSKNAGKSFLGRFLIFLARNNQKFLTKNLMSSNPFLLFHDLLKLAWMHELLKDSTSHQQSM